MIGLQVYFLVGRHVGGEEGAEARKEDQRSFCPSLGNSRSWTCCVMAV